MLRVKEVERVLARAMTDGLTNVMLVSDEGALIAAARSEEADHTASAVLASVYSEYKVAERFVEPVSGGGSPSSLQAILFDCEAARVACVSFVQCSEDSQILLCVCSDKQTHYGVLWSKLELLKESLKCLEPILMPMAGAGSG
ncbi:unnamed protein product [Polarella glacialis]|uniref:Late endosomal/lysosomal adaptor and MAPK and MTOR activator 5 n=2 Tax=Polarella glacialis TaxID=89957 RepID=A0A813KJE1_POLGL|nr:unnamed protein product [Polarella glacialis]